MTDDATLKARAGDYVLGVMDEDERERAERDMERDPAFRDAVMTIAGSMHALDLTAKPESVDPEMWNTIAARISSMPQYSPVDTKTVPEAANDTVPSRPRGINSGSGWKGALAAASLLVACGAGYFAGVTTSKPTSPVAVIVLNTDSNVPGAVFEAYADNSVRILSLDDFEVPAGKTLQAWTLYDQSVGPVSLGTFAKSDEVRLKGPAQPPPKADQLYEITLEPETGSPTGKPTGPILVKGFARKMIGA